MSKCKKNKDACKICLQTVTHRTGLRCEGACRSWVHYSCLNYTPGRIKDIKAGIIKVTCPCPDCETQLPKEYRVDEPYRCVHHFCPANQNPKCEEIDCPSNYPPPPPSNPPAPCFGVPPDDDCGKQCKNQTRPVFTPPRSQSNPATPTRSSPCSCKTSSEHVSGDRQRGTAMPSMNAVEQMCNTVGQLTNQINELMNTMKQEAERSSSGGSSCTQSGPKSMCPKPCFCPGNPGRKK